MIDINTLDNIQWTFAFQSVISNISRGEFTKMFKLLCLAHSNWLQIRDFIVLIDL